MCRRKPDVLNKSARKLWASSGENVWAINPSTRMSLAWTTGFIGRVSDNTDHELQDMGLLT